MDYKTGKQKIIFEDSNPTHYIDVGKTKDSKYIILSSSTKEDSEVWVLDSLDSDS